MSRPLYISVYDTEIRITKQGKGYGITIPTVNIFNSEDINAIAEDLASTLKTEKFRGRKAIVVMCNKGIITRMDRVPKMKEKLLDKAIRSNINDYFPAVNIDDYEWRYSIVKEVEDNGNKFYEILLSAIPAYHIRHIKKLLNIVGIKVPKITLWPYLVLNTYSFNIMALDGNSNGVHLLLLKEGNLITYTNLPIKIEKDMDTEELHKEVRGYLEYYKSRNQGETVDNVVVLGELGLLNNFLHEARERYDVLFVSKRITESIYTINDMLADYSKKIEANFIPHEILEFRAEALKGLQTMVMMLGYVAIMATIQHYAAIYAEGTNFRMADLNYVEESYDDRIKIAKEQNSEAKLAELQQYEKIAKYDDDTVPIMASINGTIPNNVSITGLHLKHVQLDAAKSSKKKKEEAYEKIPNVLVMDGEATGTTEQVGLMVNKLSEIGYITSIDIKSMTKTEGGKVEFTIEATLGGN